MGSTDVSTASLTFPKKLHGRPNNEAVRTWKCSFSLVWLVLSSLLDLYCTLEVDSYGYFVSKAKTRVFRDTTEPQWNEVSHRSISLHCSVSFTVQQQTSDSPSLSLCHFKGVWDWVRGLPVPADPVLREVLRQKQAQQGRQRDRGQDHGKRPSPGKENSCWQAVTETHRSHGRCLCSLGDVSQHVTHFN